MQFHQKMSTKLNSIHTSGHCTGINLLYTLSEPSLPFSEEHQQKNKTIKQTGIWITEKALNCGYGPLKKEEYVTLLCYKMSDTFRNETIV